MNNSELAHRLGWSPSKVTNLFKGKRGAIETDVAQILGLCGITGPERDRLLRLTKEAHEPGWWHDYGDQLPPRVQVLIDHEDSAVAIIGFEAALIPGLLQTTDYMRALMRNTATIPYDGVEERIQARLKRQEVLSRRTRPPSCHFFIEEYAFRRTGPGREIMSGQVHHLLRMAVRPHIKVQVVPDSVGFHAGRKPFHLMEFAEIGPVIHVEDETSFGFLERAETVATYRRIIAALAAVALNEGQSREWIATLASELSEPWRDRDEPNAHLA